MVLRAAATPVLRTQTIVADRMNRAGTLLDVLPGSVQGRRRQGSVSSVCCAHWHEMTYDKDTSPTSRSTAQAETGRHAGLYRHGRGSTAGGVLTRPNASEARNG